MVRDNAVYLAGLVLLAASPSARAAPEGGPEDGPGEREASSSIVVTGRALDLPPGSPAYGTVLIPRERLENNAAGRIEDLLQDVAGFQQFRRSDSRSANPSAQGATLRALGGNASSRALVLLDGVPTADPFFGYIPFNALTPDRLSAVRVTRGGGAGAFGAGAVAGTIEMVSAERADLPRLAASAFYGSHDATELSGAVTQDLGGGFVTLSGRWDRGDGFQTTPASQRSVATVPAAYDGWSASLRAVAPLGAQTEVQFRALVFDDERTLRFRGADSSSSGQDASIRLVSRGRWQIDALAYVQARNFSNIVISASTFRKSLDQRNTPSTGIGGKIELRPPVGESHVLRLGTDLRIATGDMYEDAYNANNPANPRTNLRHAGGRQTTLGFFAENDWTLGSLVLTGGVRADRWAISDGFYRVELLSGAAPVNPCAAPGACADRSDWQVSGRAGALLHVSEAVALRGAAYTGFRLPTLNELYRSFVVFPITTNANPGLTPEKLRGAEAGVDLTPAPGITLSATAFTNRLGDAIANISTATTNVRQRRNVRAIVAKGIELSASARKGDVQLFASYAYSHATVHAPGQGFDGLTPAQSPRHSASGTLMWAPRGGPALSATLRYVSRQYEDDLQSDALRGAVTLDGTASLPLAKGVAIMVRGENITDTRTITRNAAGSLDLGKPRTLWIGLKIAR